MPIKYNTEIFKSLSNDKHNFEYDYSLVDYKNNHTNVKIICSKHGIFEQQPQVHMKGGGCNKCVREKISKKIRMNQLEFIEKSNRIHKNKYDYSLIEYVNQNVKIKIICPEHGIFLQSPKSHLNNKSGCPLCDFSHKSNTDEFIKKSITVHGDTYSYDKVKYLNAIKKIIIVCKKHGDFSITPNNHLRGKGCPICRLSNGEREIKKILELKNVKYIRQKFFKDCIHIKPLKFDFYLPDYNVCIEYDGEQHDSIYRFEKDTERLKIRKFRDQIKNIYCEEKRIKLIRISHKEDIIAKLKEIIDDN